MDLSVKDRLMIMSVLPKQGDIITLRAVKDIEDLVSFTADELGFLELDVQPTGVKWKDEYSDYTIKVDIPRSFLEIIKQALTDLNRKQKLQAAHLDIYEKFVEK